MCAHTHAHTNAHQSKLENKPMETITRLESHMLKTVLGHFPAVLFNLTSHQPEVQQICISELFLGLQTPGNSITDLLSHPRRTSVTEVQTSSLNFALHVKPSLIARLTFPGDSSWCHPCREKHHALVGSDGTGSGLDSAESSAG